MTIRVIDQSDEDDPKGRINIPKGKAMLSMDNNGWVGTNNGWPMLGQPALYPESQARAISWVFNFMGFLGEDKVREMLPHPEEVPDEVWAWIFNWRESHNHSA